jgi:hypothetical protein
MSKPNAASLLLLVLGLSAAVLLIVVWRKSLMPAAGSPPPLTATSSGPPLAASEAVPTDRLSTSDLPPGARAWLAALSRDLARGGVREREAILTFKDDAALQAFLRRAEQAGLATHGIVPGLRAVRVRFDSLDALQRELAGNASDYAGVAANPLIGLPHPPAREDRPAVNQVPFGNDTLAALGAAVDRSSWGRGTTIAILDTGVAPDPTFGSGRLRSLDIGFGSTPGSGSDDGHGTSVAALAAGLAPDAPGVAPAANLLSIRVTDASGTSDLFTVSQAIVSAVDAGARIINISLGGYATGAVLDAAIDHASRNGALIVAAAGNDQAAQLAWPAADPRVLSVGAIDRLEQQVSFSNSGEQLQLTAPGYGVQTAWLNSQRVTVDGTSASAPIVAGAVAAVLSQNPNLSPQQAAAILVQTANDAGVPGADAAYGRGILNLGTAMNRDNAAYVDTAVSSHSYDAASGQMQFVVQNRSGRTLSGLSLAITTGTVTSTQSVPSLVPGETYVARVTVGEANLKSAATLTYSTQLTNPLGVVDQVPANNRRSSVLTITSP